MLRALNMEIAALSETSVVAGGYVLRDSAVGQAGFTWDPTAGGNHPNCGRLPTRVKDEHRNHSGPVFSCVGCDSLRF